MSGWQIGDLALCVDDGPCPCCGQLQAVRRGAIYTVADLIPPEDYGDPDDGFLVLHEVEHAECAEHGYLDEVAANCFRKIKPDAHESCEDEFIELLKRSKRRVEA